MVVSPETGHNRPMTKKLRLGLAVVLAIALCGGSVLWLWQPTEPVYKGKPLHYWLQGYDGYPSSIFDWNANGPTPRDAGEAVVALGTNAIPELLGMLVHRPSPLMPPLLSIGRKIHIVKGQPDNPYARNWEAQSAFNSLADRAAVAVPELIQLYDSHPDPSSRTAIVYVLREIGPNAKAAVPVLLRAMTNASDHVRVNAVGALSEIDTNAAQELPALIA